MSSIFKIQNWKYCRWYSTQLKTNATRIYIVQYTTRCVKKLIDVLHTITESDK